MIPSHNRLSVLHNSCINPRETFKTGNPYMTRINQQTLAEVLNLSQTTVSRALANHPAINAETKARVWAYAAQSGYRMAGPRNRTSRNSNDPVTIGVLIAIPKRERGYAETSQLVLQGIADNSSTEAVALDVLYQEPSRHNSRQIQKRVRQNRWKGCILIHPMAGDVIETLSKTLPCVSIIENYRMDYFDSVDVDQIEAISTLVRHLHQHGHRRIGYLSWVYDVPTPWVYHRFGAYVETVFQLGLPFSDDWVLNLRPGERMNPEEVADKAVQCIRSGTTAFVCAADHQAYLLRSLLRKRGIEVPRDCSLTGFDGIEPPNDQSQIATVRVPYDEIGRSAFHQLLRRIAHPTSARRHVQVDGEFLEGDSVAPPGVLHPQ